MSSAPAPRILVVLLAFLTLSACAATSQPELRAGPGAAGQPRFSTPSPTDQATTGTPSPGLSGKPKPKSLEWYVARVPTFPEAPPPVPVALTASGPVPFWHRVPTDQKVAFITIDDGELARPNAVPDFIREARIPVTMFLNSPAAAKYPDYFKRIEAAGGVVENHTINHRSLKGKSYAFQKGEICGSADRLEQLFGKRPTLFRPPFGERDSTTTTAARDCGAKAVLHWTETVNKGIVRYQTAEKVVKPGDVLLMHFRPALMDDLLGALKAIHAAGLTPALLEDYVR